MPLEDNYYKVEEIDLVNSTDLEKHAVDYCWFVSRYGGDITYTAEQARKKLLEIKKEEYLENYRKNKEAVAATILRAKTVVGDQLAYLVDGLQFIVFYRTHRTDVISRAMYLHIPVLKIIATQAGLTYDDLTYCLASEILSKTIPQKTIIEERKHGFAIASVDNKIICFVGKEFEALRDKLEDKIDGASEVNGSSASKGVVVGKVKVIHVGGDFSKIEPGDILVTSMTTPEMVPIMKVAAAFVTDEGGITCHAAIVAREMKKPCVIGTKTATTIFKDGDIVEVNADNGVVRILK